jgi:hypothetical protein
MVSQISAPSQELPCCPGSFAGSSRFLLLNSTYSYSCAPTQRDRVAWLWALFFAFAAPEVASFLMALRAILMRSTSSPTIIELAVCLAFELIHTVGVAILFFIAFPGEPFMYNTICCDGIVKISGNVVLIPELKTTTRLSYVGAFYKQYFIITFPFVRNYLES